MVKHLVALYINHFMDLMIKLSLPLIGEGPFGDMLALERSDLSNKKFYQRILLRSLRLGMRIYTTVESFGQKSKLRQKRNVAKHEKKNFFLVKTKQNEILAKKHFLPNFRFLAEISFF